MISKMIPFWKRWPIIRHMRALWHSWRMAQHYRFYQQLGYGDGTPRKCDRDHLRKIWEGEA